MIFKSLVTLSLLMTLNGCATIKKIREKALKQRQDMKKLDNHVYKQNLQEMKKIVLESFTLNSDLTFVFTDQNAGKSMQNSHRIKEAIEKEGFLYNGKIYKRTEVELDLSELFKGNVKASDLFTSTAPYFVLEESENRIVIAKDNISYELSKVEKGTTLRAKEIKAIKRVPSAAKNSILRAGAEIIRIFKGWSIDVDKGAIDWQASLKTHGIRNKAIELPLYYKSLESL